MVTVVFYEKPGCINNTKQKKLLVDAGHTVHAKNLLTNPWTSTQLKKFFGDLSVSQWFNQSAPQVKSGEIDPRRLTPTKATTLMLSNPLLIRRPLMMVGEVCRVGFDQDEVDAWIGLSKIDLHQDLESCPRNHEITSCT